MIAMYYGYVAMSARCHAVSKASGKGSYVHKKPSDLKGQWQKVAMSTINPIKHKIEKVKGSYVHHKP